MSSGWSRRPLRNSTDCADKRPTESTCGKSSPTCNGASSLSASSFRLTASTASARCGGSLFSCAKFGRDGAPPRTLAREGPTTAAPPLGAACPLLAPPALCCAAPVKYTLMFCAFCAAFLLPFVIPRPLAWGPAFPGAKKQRSRHARGAPRKQPSGKISCKLEVIGSTLHQHAGKCKTQRRHKL